MKSCAIFSGGVIKNLSSIDITHLKDYLIICADAGYLYAKKLGIKTDIIVGDFDTLGYIPKDVDKVIRHIPEKDDTDTMLAIKTALDNDCKYIEIYGALGGRLDHTFANIQALSYIKSYGAEGKIISDNEIIMLICNEKITLHKRQGYSLSLFSYTDKCIGVTETGVKYPLSDYTLTSDFPLGISNEIIEDFAQISVKCGKILIIQSKI